MKKALSFILCLVMIFTSVPVAFAQGSVTNPIAGLVLPEELTLFLDDYNVDYTADLTVTLVGEIEGEEITDREPIEWRTLDTGIVGISVNEEDDTTATLKALGIGTTKVFAEITDSSTGVAKVQGVCKVTVRKSLKAYAEEFKVYMNDLPSDVDDKSPVKYSAAALVQLDTFFSSVQEHFNNLAEFDSYADWRDALVGYVSNMEDTEENCALVNGWKNGFITVLASLANSVIALDNDEEFWGKWNAAYAKVPEDVMIAFALLPQETDTAYTKKSVEPVLDVLSRQKKEWLKSDKEEIDALAQELSEAIAGLKEHTTSLKFESDRIVKNYGTGTFKIPYTIEGYDEIKWYSTDDDIVSVTQNGYATVLSAVPDGYKKEIRIFAVSNGITASCEIVILNPIKNIAVSERLAVLIGEPKQLVVDITGVYEGAPVTESPVFEYLCDNEDVAVIDENGMITPIEEGSCNITVSIKGNTAIEPVSCKVTVAPAQKITKLIVVNVPTQVTVNATAEAKLFVYPQNATSKEIKWTSYDESIATVTAITTDEKSYATAAVKGIGSGTVTIKYEATDGSGVCGYFDVTVNPLVSMIMFDKKSIVTYIGNTEEELKIKATCQPVNAGNQRLLWFSSDDSVATVIDGKITVHKTGTCTIFARAQDGSGVEKSATLLVLGDAASIKLSDSPEKINIGETVDFDCTVVTKEGISYDVSDWSVSDKSLASISADGVLKALLPGKVTVTAKYFDGTKATRTITIFAPLDGISLPTSITVAYGKTKTITPTYTPSYASNKKVTWTTSDASVVSISTAGVITAAGIGTATITAKSEEGGYISVCKVIVIQPVSGIAIKESSYTLTIGVKDTVKLSAAVSPSNATTKSVTWKSSNTKVATVSTSGIVTAKGPGVSNITVTTLDGGYTATCKITVRQPLKGIKFASSKVTYYVGQEKALSVVFTPSNASNKGLTYKSSDKAVATVSSKGVVTAKKKGSCTITAVSDDGSFKAVCTLKVVKKVNVEEVEITRSSLKLDAGKKKQLNVEIYPENASMRDVKWTTSDKSIVSVSSEGVVTAHKGGTATIKCTSLDTGVSDKCKVTVKEDVKKIVLSASSATLVAGKTKTLSAEVLPETATDKGITWYSTSKSIAKVSSSGRVTALKGGTCKIVAKSKDNPDIVAKCKITVLQPPTKITLSETEMEITKGDKAILTATVKPKDSFDSSVQWTSSRTSVAKVSDNGVITAVSAGTAVITCSSTVDPSVKRSCNITVYQPVTGVSLSAEKLTLTTGRTKTLVATVSPSKATNKKVTFKTSNKSVVRVTSKGVIEAMGPGQATITVRTEDGFYTAKCIVTVVEPVVGIKLDKKSTNITIGKSKTLTATVKPSNATNKDVVWRSSNPLVARVTQSGNVQALTEGKATITCTTVDGAFKATCTVNCIIPVDAVTLKDNAVSLKKGSSKTLKATIYPKEATYHDVLWESSDKSVATVDKYGKVTGVKKGACIITCTTKQGKKKATCLVTVK